MKTSKICIVLPCLNARRFLEPRVESLQRQTHGDWKALVLDSHSTDGSWEFFESVAKQDPRFELHRVPREGLYAALNRGIEMAEGEFFHIATCDDTMHPEYLATMLELFARFPAAGIAASDVKFLDAAGDELPPTPLFGSGRVRTAVPGEVCREANYRPAPHDCFLHLAGGTVYFSLTQLLARMTLVKQAPRFDVTVGSIADFGWSLNLTNLAGTAHAPQPLATWRYHGDQLSMRADDTRHAAIVRMCRQALPGIQHTHRRRLSRSDVAALLVPSKLSLARSRRAGGHLRYYLEAGLRLLWMLLEKPVATVQAIRRSHFRYGNLKHSWVALILGRAGVALTTTSAHERGPTPTSETSG